MAVGIVNIRVHIYTRNVFRTRSAANQKIQFVPPAGAAGDSEEYGNQTTLPNHGTPTATINSS